MDGRCRVGFIAPKAHRPTVPSDGARCNGPVTAACWRRPGSSVTQRRPNHVSLVIGFPETPCSSMQGDMRRSSEFSSPSQTILMHRARHQRFPLVALAALIASASASAQTSTPAQPAPQPSTVPPVSVSGLLFGSYNYQLPTTPAQLANQNDNGFILDRAYLNFRAPAGDRLSIRVTTDVYQTAETNTQNAYTIRAKYAYLQYDVPKFSNGASAFARLGILQNVVIDHIESFWPRYLSQTAVERAGFFSSADVGFAAGSDATEQDGRGLCNDHERAGLCLARARPIQGLRDPALTHAAREPRRDAAAPDLHHHRLGLQGRNGEHLRQWRGGADRAGGSGARPQPRRRVHRPERSAAGAGWRIRGASRRRRRRCQHDAVARASRRRRLVACCRASPRSVRPRS